jgi:hypothetical protein
MTGSGRLLGSLAAAVAVWRQGLAQAAVMVAGTTVLALEIGASGPAAGVVVSVAERRRRRSERPRGWLGGSLMRCHSHGGCTSCDPRIPGSSVINNRTQTCWGTNVYY